MRITPLLTLAAIGLFSVASRGALLSWSSTAPTPDGEDISNFTGTSSDTGNILGGDDNGTYVAANRPPQGQTFTTGSNVDGYELHAITLQHVGYSPTWWSIDTGWTGYNGGRWRIQIGVINGTNFAAIATEEAYMDFSAPPNGAGVAGTSYYFTLTLDNPVVLDPNIEYAFVITTTADSNLGDSPYIELNGDGTTSANYSGGEAFSLTGTVAGGNVTNIVASRTGDRVFHLDMTVNTLPFSSIQVEPTGSFAGSDALLQAVVVDGLETFESAILYLDGLAVATNSTYSGPTNRVEYYMTGLSSGWHNCSVDVVSSNQSPSIAASKYWFFEVLPFGDITGTPTGWTIDSNVTVQAVIEHGGSAVDINNTILTVDLSPVAASIQVTTSNTIVGFQTNLTHGTHIAQVEVFGSPSGYQIYDWLFEVVQEASIPIAEVHHWDFEDNDGTVVTDVVGAANGTIVGTNHAWFAGGLDLFGGETSADWNPDSTTTTNRGSYVNLPNGILGALSNAVTFEATYSVDSTWPDLYLWTFGQSNAEDYSNGGTKGLGYRSSQGGGPANIFLWDGINPDHANLSDIVNVSERVGLLTHVVWVYDADGLMSKLYINGGLVDAQVATFFPLSSWVGLDEDNNNWLGRSLWDDGMFEGRIYDFRIYNGIMTASGVAARYAEVLASSAPTIAPVIQSITYSSGIVTLTWTAEDKGIYSIWRKTSLTDPGWSVVLSNLPAGNFSTNFAAGGTQEFYQIRGE